MRICLMLLCGPNQGLGCSYYCNGYVVMCLGYYSSSYTYNVRNMFGPTSWVSISLWPTDTTESVVSDITILPTVINQQQSNIERRCKHKK
jgi:hypothetical protein